MSLDVLLFDGTVKTIDWRSHDTIGTLRQRLGPSLGVQAGALQIAVDGKLMDVSVPLRTLPPKPHVVAWCQRYTRHVSDDALRVSRSRTAAIAITAREWWPWCLRCIRSMAVMLLELPLSVWAHIAFWLLLTLAARSVDLLGPFLILFSAYLVYTFGFQDRAPGEESAFTVFNDGRALPGQLRGEDLERDLVRGL